MCTLYRALLLSVSLVFAACVTEGKEPSCPQCTADEDVFEASEGVVDARAIIEEINLPPGVINGWWGMPRPPEPHGIESARIVEVSR